MGKKQNLKKAAQMLAAASAAAASGAAEKEAKTDKTKPEDKAELKMDAATRNSLEKLMNLAKKLPGNLLAPKKQQPEPTSDLGNSDSDGEDKVSSSDSDDEVPDLVDLDKLKLLRGPGEQPRMSRGEKKARRILMKLDLKPLDNVARVSMRKNKNILLYIDRPDVYRVPHSDTFICFGEVRVEDISNAATAKAAERYRNVKAGEKGEGSKNEKEVEGAEAQADDDEEVEVDEEAAKELDDKDIELVQMQANCSRTKAIRALLKNDNDVVNAIMALTVG